VSKYLLDTNAWLRIVAQPDKVSQRVKRILVNASNEVFVSHVALWEIAIKRSLGRLELNTYEATDVLMARVNSKAGITPISIASADIAAVQYLPWHHKDPFDRLLIAQAQQRGLTVVSSDRLLEQYDVKVIW